MWEGHRFETYQCKMSLVCVEAFVYLWHVHTERRQRQRNRCRWMALMESNMSVHMGSDSNGNINPLIVLWTFFPLPLPPLSVNTPLRSVRTWQQRCVFFCRHVWTVPLVTMQPISDGIKNYADIIKNLCRCRQVRKDPYENLCFVQKQHCYEFAKLRLKNSDGSALDYFDLHY